MEEPNLVTPNTDNNENIDQSKILNEVKKYESKQMYIITKEIDSKISNILSYIQNDENEIFNKIYVLNYLFSSIKNIPYNLELILAKKSNNLKQKMNLYEIIIHQFIYIDQNEKEYIQILKNLLMLIFKKMSYNKDIYRYIFSFLRRFLNEKNNNEKNNENYFNEYNYFKLLESLLLFYQSNEDDDPINYFYFNGEENTNITINNTENNYLNLNTNIFLLLFVKLIDYSYISSINENNEEQIEASNLLKIKFKDMKDNIFINIGYKEMPILNNFIINIPYKSFNIKETNYVFLEIGYDKNIRIFVNNIQVDLPSKMFQEDNKKKNILESLQFFNGFYGLCSTIMIYRNSHENNLKYFYPQYLIEKNDPNKRILDNSISKYYQNGLFKEEILIPFIKAELKYNVAEKNIFNEELNNLSDEKIKDLKNFINYNLISLYTPTRTYINSYLKTKIEGTKSIIEVIREIILVDSINNFNVKLNNNSLYSNLSFSMSGGVHTLSNIIQDFSMDIGGINHFLPLIEVMTDYNELLTNDNLSMFMNIILYFFSNHKKLIQNEKNGHFFYYLSLFLERLPGEFCSNLSVHIKSILLTLECLESDLTDNELFIKYTPEFFNNVCLNEKILFKFSFKERTIIYDQIYKFLFKRSSESKYIDLNIKNLINILLYHEKEKYTHFCCKKHADYFKKESKIMEPELLEYIKPLIKIINLLFNQFVQNTNLVDIKESNPSIRNKLIKLFELLTLDITPCLQIIILKLFFEFVQKIDEKYYDYLNINNNIILITLFVYKNALFDVKELAFNYLIWLANKNANKNSDLDKFIEYYTTYFYYPQIEDKQEKNNLKATLTINDIKYNLRELTDSQKQLLSFYDKNHFNESMKNIFDKAEDYFKKKICLNINFNILISITSKGDINYILRFLNLIQEELQNKKTNNMEQFNLISNSRKLLTWLLDTCYQAYLIKKSLINKEEFIPGFSFGKLETKEEKEKNLDKIILLSSNLILNIFYNSIYNLDYLLTWSKYYNEIKEDKNRFTTIRKFIFDYFIEKIINRYTDKTYNYDSDNNKITPKQKLYFANIIFEYLAFHQIKGYASGGVLKDLDSLYQQVCPSFIYTILSLIQTRSNINEDNLYFLKEKWDEYSCIQKLLGNLEFFNLDKENKKINDEKNIYYTFIHGKKNTFINELKIYFTNFEYIKKKYQNSYCNHGMELIILKYHYFTLLLTVVINNIEFKNILNDLRSFILLIIIASSTISIDDSKNQKNKNITVNEIWPTENEYQNIQKIVKCILFNFLLFLNDKITEMTKKLKQYENNTNDNKNKIFFDNYNSIKKYLINTMLFILRELNTIYKNVTKEDIIKKNSTGLLKGWYNTLKSKLSGEKEGIKLTGGYTFIDEFMNNCIIEINDNINENPNSNLNDNFTEVEIKKTFLDEIPQFSLNSINEKEYVSNKLNSKLESIFTNNIENNEKIKNYFLDYKEQYQKQLFPFIQYILNRYKSISNIIPTYDNSRYTKFEYNYLCLKPNYLPELQTNKINNEIHKFNANLVNEIRMYQIELNFNEHDKIRKYRKIKKKLFSFNGILSTKKYFYEKKKYICKYRLLNHMTEDYTKIFLTPIIDIDYYLPKFSRFELKNLFRTENKDNLIQITKLVDLSLKNQPKTEIKKEEEKEISNLNGLYLIKESEFKEMNEINKDIEGTLNHYKFYKNFIDNKHKITGNYHNCIQNSCLVKPEYHIRGFFYNNEKEIGFYSYDKIPYNNDKKSKKKDIDENIKKIQIDYDPDRKACFGSVFSPQTDKYEYLHFTIPYNDIIFVLKRRYYFKISSLEIFTSDKKSYFFKLDHNILGDILGKIKHYMNPKPEDITIEYNKFYSKIGFLNPNSISKNMNKIIYQKNYMNLKNIYEKWKNWEISTMNLLMFINIYANRSFNDINQYPVFPWILTDYKSDKFPEDISKNVIRPLDTPMGMLEVSDDARQRKQDYMDHWQISQDDEDREDEYDRYGSHYSTSLYVSYYLVRIFPFASIRIELQGTSFDDPNRLFNSMKTSFDCSSTQKSDVRELIPELFCMPEILLNNNDFNLGEIKDNSENNKNSKEIKLKKIQEVETPKWCKNNAYFFIKKHRELLESLEVSKTLNKWINLIFGSKQKGEEGHKIKNLYNCQTYEDYETIFDNMPDDEKDIACRMLEFGVTPNQIFKSDTSQRSIKLDKKIKKKLFYNTLDNIIQNKINEKIKLKDFIVFEMIKDNINAFSPQKIFYFPKDKNSDNYRKNIYIMNHKYLNIYIRKMDTIIINKDKPIDPNYSEYLYGDDSYLDEIPIKIIEKKEETINLADFKYRNNNNQQPINWLDKGTIIVKGGYWNGDIILKNIIKEKINSNNPNKINDNEEINRIFIYTTNEYSPITKIVIDKNETFAICGNENGTIYIYKINQKRKFIWNLYKYINNHNSPISSIGIHENLNIAITCSKNGLCMLYSLPDFKLYNSFIIGKDDNETNNEEEYLCPDITLISDSPLPCFIFYINLKRTIYFYSINGHLLKKQKLNYSIQENSIKIYRDYKFIDYLFIYNTRNQTFDLYTMIDFTLIFRSKPLNDDIFVDFVLSEEMDHALVLCKSQIEKNYKLYILKYNENDCVWK